MEQKLMAVAGILPQGFAGVMGKLITAKAAAAASAPKKANIGLLAEAQAAVALGKRVPLLTFKSLANYTYNRHAAAMHSLYVEGDAAGLEAYPLKGTNTYARALTRYRATLLQALKG